MADSTKMVDNSGKWAATETYKTFLLCAAKIIRSQGGAITAYDGDRVMAVFIGDSKNTSAVRAALKIKWAVSNIINPAKKKQYTEDAYPLQHVVGIDTSELFVANAGVRGAKDLVWVGRAANHAAKLSALPASFTYITEAVYNNMADEAKLSSGTNMWQAVNWNTLITKRSIDQATTGNSRHGYPSFLQLCSTTDQIAQSLSVSRLTFPLLETERSSRPSSMAAAVIQALIPCLTQMGIATVRMRLPFPSRSARTQRPSLCWMVSTSSSASSFRLRAQPTRSARMT
jgi:class 3 adenylate cyclase